MNNDIYMNGGQTASIQMVADFDGDINSLFSICKDGEMVRRAQKILRCRVMSTR